MPFAVIDPATGRPVRTVAPLSADAALARLGAAHAAFASWRDRPLAARQRVVRALADALHAHDDQLAAHLVQEMGKPRQAALAEVRKCARLCTEAADDAPRALADEPALPRPTDDGSTWSVRHEPLGVLLAVMPWNFPYWQFLRVLVPNLLAGNAVLHKPAGSVPGAAAALHALLADVLADGDASPDLAPLLLVEHDVVPVLVADERLAGVTLTGSERAGRAVARAAGEALKPVVLELGGSDPFVVLDDADVPRAARVAAEARTVNAGQSCIAAKRFIVHDAVYDTFLAAFVDAMRALRVGDPARDDTDIGPLATEAIRDTVARQVADSVRAGARCVLGGEPPARAGWWYPPTVLVDVPRDAPVATEEVFGPVAPVFRADDDDAALALANATTFGLGASVWTRDAARRERFVRDLAAGMVTVNGQVVSDPRAPFGGIRRSGIGRELGVDGFRAFTNRKTVRVFA